MKPRLFFAAALALSGCQTGHDLAAVQAGRGPDLAYVRQHCAALARYDLADLYDGAFDPSEVRAMWGWPSEAQLGDADIVLRMSVPPGFGGDRTTQTIARRAGGVWHVRRQDDFLTSSPPPPPPSADAPPPDPRPRRGQHPIQVIEGALDAATATQIEDALNDACLAHEPASVGGAMKLRNGELETCLDGAVFALQIERAEGVRTFVQGCTTRFRSGELIRILERVNPPGATIVNRDSPLILINPDGSESRVNDDGTETIVVPPRT